MASVTRLHTFHFLTFKPLKICFNFSKDLDPSYPVLKLGDNWPSSNRDMAQNVILQTHALEGHLWIFCKTFHTLPMSLHGFIHWDLINSFCGKVEPKLAERWPELRLWQKHFDSGWLWRILRHERTIWRRWPLPNLKISF